MKKNMKKMMSAFLAALLLSQSFLMSSVSLAEEVCPEELFSAETAGEENELLIEEVVEIEPEGEISEAAFMESSPEPELWFDEDEDPEGIAYFPEEAEISGIEEVVELPFAPEEEEEEEEIFTDEETGFVLGGALPEEVKKKRPLLLSAGSGTSYDGRKNFAGARAQGGTEKNTCWAFSTAALSEASLVKAGKAAASSVDYSELALAYFMYNSPADDPLGLTGGDKNTIANGKNFLSIGGNPQFAVMMLSGWEGMISESKAPYSSASESMTLPDSLCFEDEAVLTETRLFDITKNADLVKNAVKQYGGVTIEYFSTSTSEYKTDSEGRVCRYMKTPVAANHSAVIVGWNDSFPKESFRGVVASGSTASAIPSEDGAWLVRNSWGDTFGEKGYFWLSYEDATIGKTAIAMKFEPAEAYDHNYHYDGTAGYNTNIYQSKNTTGETVTKATLASGGSAGNIFKASDHAQELKAVTVGVKTASMKLSVQVYQSASVMDNPEDGVPVFASPVTASTTASGIYKITLPEAVYIPKNTYFSVVVTVTAAKEGSAVELYTDKTLNYTVDGAPYLSLVNATEEGQSFVKTQSTSKWADWYYTTHPSWTFRIKALTCDCAERKIIPQSLTLPETLVVGVGKTQAPKFTVSPSTADAEMSYSWSVKDTTLAAAGTDGMLRGLKAGYTEVTCVLTYRDNDGKEQKLSATANLRVQQYPDMIYFDPEEKSVAKGSSAKFSVKLEPAKSSVEGLTFSWSSDDSSVCTMRDSGSLICSGTAKAEGECNIIVRCNEIPSLWAICWLEVTPKGTGGGTGGGGGGSGSGGGGTSGGTKAPGAGPGSAGTGTGTFSRFWYQDATNSWKITDNMGMVIANAWLCDNAVAANGFNVWYLLDQSGNMLTGGLVRDNTGNYYSLEMEHNGYFGMLRYQNGTYDGIYMEFSQVHDGTFGKILNQDAIDALNAKYGVTYYPVGNENCVYTADIEAALAGK